MDPATLALIGAVTGVLGAVTGIAGFVLGVIGYRRSNQIKALDLRLELRKRRADLQLMLDDLAPLLHRAQGSRGAVLAATGLARSGAHEVWKKNGGTPIAKRFATASSWCRLGVKARRRRRNNWNRNW